MKKFVSLMVAVIMLVTMGLPVMAFADEEVICRKPVVITKTYNPSVSVSNEFVNGSFHATVTVKYQAQGGGYSISYCDVSNVYFSGVVRTDFASKVTGFYSSSDGAGHVTIGFTYQVKYEKNGVTYYSDMMTAYCTFSL